MDARNSLKGKVVIVAGGAKNLGGQISRTLAHEGVGAVTIHFNSDATLAAAKETASYVEAQGVKTLLVQADLTSTAEIVKLFQKTKETFGGIDVAINTTGLVLKKPLIDVTEEEYDQSFDINSKAAFFFLREGR
jgi:NAD(P)-dependent dehydrogenase (short-subunit alcohol dehydrogenase family)